MKNFINSIEGMVKDAVDGFCAAHHDKIISNASPLYITRSVAKANKVSLVSGGGSGHEPLHIGFIGEGMLDAVCPGQFFSSPTPDQIISAINKVNVGKGVLLIVKNYPGDKMNFTLASKVFQQDVETIIVSDEAVSDGSEARGLAGTLVIEKVVGAAAEQGEDISFLKALAEKVNNSTKTIGAALSPLTLPGSNQLMYEIAENEVEYAVGIHGEKGKERISFLNAHDMAVKMVDDILHQLDSESNNKILLFVNGLGGTPSIELYTIYHEALMYLNTKGYDVIRSLVGNYVTSFSTHGCSITLSVFDEDVLGYWDSPVDTAILSW